MSASVIKIPQQAAKTFKEGWKTAKKAKTTVNNPLRNNCQPKIRFAVEYRTGLIFFILGYYLIYDSIEGG